MGGPLPLHTTGTVSGGKAVSLVVNGLFAIIPFWQVPKDMDKQHFLPELLEEPLNFQNNAQQPLSID